MRSGSHPRTAGSSARPGSMYVWDFEGLSLTCLILDPQSEVAILRVDRFPF